MICETDLNLCPITTVYMSYDIENKPSVEVSKQPFYNPVMSYRWSTQTPCLNDTEVPALTLGQTQDEYLNNYPGCSQFGNLKYFEDTDYRVAGTFSIRQGTIES